MFTQIGIIESQLDYDAINFCSAAGITDQTQVLALHYLVSNIKLSNLWAKCKAIYPFVGGTASTHKWNLKDPRDLDAAFRLVFNGGGWTHSSTGAKPNGTTSYADTFLTPRTSMDNTTFGHLSYYSRTNSAIAFEYVMGAFDGTGLLGLMIRRNTNQRLFGMDASSGTSFRGASDTSSTDGRGFFSGSQQGANIKLYRNGTSVVSNTTATTNTASANVTVWIGGLNSGFFTDKECAFASIGESLTDAEMATFNTIVQQYQTILGRNV